MNEIKTINDLLIAVKLFNKTNNSKPYSKIWFRGQSEHFDLKPGVYRQSFNCITENERLLKEQRLSQDFRLMSARLLPSTLTDADRYFIQQHYGMPTRLLDWSQTPIPALFFAVENDTKDGEIYIMDASKLASTQKVEKNIFSGVGTSRNLVLKKALEVILHWKKVKDFPDFIFPIRPDLIDTRLDLQKGCFTFHVPNKEKLTVNENSSLITYKIPKDSKKDIREQLNLMGINDFNIYNNLDKLSKTLKIQYLIE